MKKLRKTSAMANTVEAYLCNCACGCTCLCTCFSITAINATQQSEVYMVAFWAGGDSSIANHSDK